MNVSDGFDRLPPPLTSSRSRAARFFSFLLSALTTVPTTVKREGSGWCGRDARGSHHTRRKTCGTGASAPKCALRNPHIAAARTTKQIVQLPARRSSRSGSVLTVLTVIVSEYSFLLSIWPCVFLSSAQPYAAAVNTACENLGRLALLHRWTRTCSATLHFWWCASALGFRPKANQTR